MKEIKSWEANDGEIFADAKDCFIHEFVTESEDCGQYFLWKDLVFLRSEIEEDSFNGIFAMGKTYGTDDDEEEVFYYSFDFEGYDEEVSSTITKNDEEYKLLVRLRKEGLIEQYEE